MSQRLRCPQGHRWEPTNRETPAPAGSQTVCPVCGSTDTIQEMLSAPDPTPDGTLDMPAMSFVAGEESGTSSVDAGPGTEILEPAASVANQKPPAKADTDDTTLLQPGAEPPREAAPLDQTLEEAPDGDAGIPTDQTVDVPAIDSRSDATLAHAESGPVPPADGATVDLPGSAQVKHVSRPPLASDQTGLFSPDVDAATMDTEGTHAWNLGHETGGGDPNATQDVAQQTERVRGKADGTSSTMPQIDLPGGSGDGPTVPGYDILGVLGRGGMGVVYKARQKGLKRLVALKMVLAGAHAGPNQLARFQIEAEAVAQLHHPNIVQVYDVGEQDGCPYFSLEYIDGGSLEGRIKGGIPLPPRAAAETVHDLSRAMDFAHQRGILHRDLKPANIMLTKSGVPKITDFGLAKRLEGDSSQTKSGTIMGTPSYMPPEQAQGKINELGPRTDLYSLGAVLYELLTGRPPFRGASIIETLQQVQFQEPVAPSQLQPKVPRDLETICLKCLEKEPAKRYESAGLLAEDLQRYLNNRPILARPTPLWERTIKWARRHPTGAALVAVSAASLLLLAGGGAFIAQREYQRAVEADRLRRDADEARENAENQERIAIQRREEAEQQRERAEVNFRHARDAVDQMLTGVGQQRLAHEPRMEKIRRDLLEKALGFYDQFLLVKSSDPAVRWETGRAYQRVGDIREALGQHEVAEKAYRTALTFFEKLTAEFPMKSEYRHDLAASHNNLGNVLKETGHIPEAVAAYGKALDLRRHLVEDATATAEQRLELAASYNNLAILLQTRNRFTEAEKDYRNALVLQVRLAADFADVPGYRQELARSYNNLGNLLEATGRIPDADRAFRQARDQFQALADKWPAVPDYRQELAISNHLLGNLLRDRNPKEAEPAYKQAIKLSGDLVADFPTIPVYRQDLAGCYNDLGILLQAAARQKDAEQAFSRALGLKEKLAADYPKIPEFRRDLANSYNDRGIALQTSNQIKEAERTYRESVQLFTRLVADFPGVPAYRQELARTYLNLGTLLQSTGHPQEGEITYRQALDLRQQLASKYATIPDYQQDLAQTWLNLATLLQINGALPGAEKAYREAITILDKLTDKGRNSPDDRHLLAIAWSNLANLLRATKRTQEAQAAWGRGLALLERLSKDLPGVPGYRQELARGRNEQAILLASAGKTSEANKEFHQTLVVQRQLVADFPEVPAYVQDLGLTHNNLGVLDAGANRLTEAEADYKEAITLREGLATKFPENAAYLQELIVSQTNLATLFTAAAQSQKAAAVWARLVPRREQLAAAFPRVPNFQSDLARALNDWARVLLDRNQPAEARRKLEAAVRFQKAALKLRPDDSYRRFLSSHYLELIAVSVRLDDHQAAAKTVGELAQVVNPGTPSLARAASLLAQCTSLAEKDAKLPEPQRKELARTYADRAVELLRKAIAAGYKDVDFLQENDFQPLRPRADFQKLIADLRIAVKTAGK